MSPHTALFTAGAIVGTIVASVFDQVAAVRFSEASAELAHGDAHADAEDAVATVSQNSWNIYDRTGPKVSNVSQGDLGDCYLLAGLAAIAHTHHELIEQVFVGPGTLSRKGLSVYRLRFLNDGKEDIVAIDDIVPMQKWGRSLSFHFATFHNGNNAWPILIEKGFAKIAGSYLSISAGFLAESFKAVTGAPVDEYMKAAGKPWKQRNVWEFVTEALDHNWPIAASSAPDRNEAIGTAESHAFAILGLGQKEGQHAVQVYNPWAKNWYAGELQHLSRDSKGDYWMLLSEFVAVFDGLTRARVLPNAHLTSKSVPVGSAYLTFSVKTDKPFYVQLQWPSKRSLPRGCTYDTLMANYGLMVSPASDPSQGVAAPFDTASHGNLRASMPGGAGEYHIMAISYFEDLPAIEEVVVNIYSQERITDLTFNPNVGAIQAANLVFGTCEEMEWEGYRFTPSPSTFRGSPLWVSSGDEIMWYFSGQGLYVSPSKSQYDYGFEDSTRLGCYGSGEGSGGGFFSWLKGLFSWAQLSDSDADTKANAKAQANEQADAAIHTNIHTSTNDNVTGKADSRAQAMGNAKAKANANALKARVTKSSRSIESDGSKEATKACDQREVKRKLQRNQDLDNYKELMAGYQDSLFPPSMVSIGEEGVDCGDAATGKRVDCADLNEWGSITKNLGKSN